MLFPILGYRFCRIIDIRSTLSLPSFGAMLLQLVCRSGERVVGGGYVLAVTGL